MDDIRILFKKSGDGYSPSMTISIESWEKLAHELRQETKLLYCTASELRKRWKDGRAVCAVAGKMIVSYISFATNFDTSFRQLLSQRTDIDTASLPTVDVYESTTGWTHTDYRGLGLQSKYTSSFMIP